MSDIQIDKYLYNEMPETEREKFEDSFVSDDALFYEIVERENELVDRYARGEMSGDERGRFERSLGDNPARRQKIENAKILREFIADERPAAKTITIAERSGFFSRLFSFGPTLQFASIGLIAILALASVFLWSENRRLGSLQQELAASRQRESELASRIDEESATSGDLTADLEAERERAAQLEAEIAKLRSTTTHPPVNNPPVTIATLFLSSAGIRGDAVPVKRFELSPGVSRVSVVVGISSDVASSESLTVTLNGERVGEKLKAKVRRGETSIAITLPAAKLKPGRNELFVSDSKDAVVARYIIAVTQNP
jgi:hypothetical protein